MASFTMVPAPPVPYRELKPRRWRGSTRWPTACARGSSEIAVLARARNHGGVTTRPSPLQWLRYAFGGRLPERLHEWVRHDIALMVLGALFTAGAYGDELRDRRLRQHHLLPRRHRHCGSRAAPPPLRFCDRVLDGCPATDIAEMPGGVTPPSDRCPDSSTRRVAR